MFVLFRPMWCLQDDYWTLQFLQLRKVSETFLGREMPHITAGEMGFPLFMQPQEVKGLIAPPWLSILILWSDGSSGVRPKAPRDSLTQCRGAVCAHCAFLISLTANLQTNSRVGGRFPVSSALQSWQSLPGEALQSSIGKWKSRIANYQDLYSENFPVECILSGWVVGCSGALSVFLILIAKANLFVVFLKALQNSVYKSALPAFLVCCFLSLPLLPSMLSHSQSIIH